MNPTSEPTASDVAVVAAALVGTPAPVQPVAPLIPNTNAAPVAAPVAPATPVAPTDPFAALITPPTEPVAPVAAPVATPPVTPTAPVEAAVPTPVVAAAPVAEEYQTYDEYLDSILAGAPVASDVPNPDDINPEDPVAIKSFFDELVNTAVTRAESNINRKAAIQNSERQLWNNAFEKYGSLRDNQPLRDMVHNIRMGYFQRNIAITPIQAADKLLESLGNQYKRGVADSAVVTTIENVQPNGGGSNAPLPTTLDTANVLESLQTGGEAALAAMLDKEIKAGRLK